MSPSPLYRGEILKIWTCVKFQQMQRNAVSEMHILEIMTNLFPRVFLRHTQIKKPSEKTTFDPMRSSHYGFAVCQATLIMRPRFQTTKQYCTSISCLVTRLHFEEFSRKRKDLCLLLFSNANQIVERLLVAQKRGRTTKNYKHFLAMRLGSDKSWETSKPPSWR